MRSFKEISIFSMLLLLMAVGCSQQKPYERHKEIAYDSLGHVRAGYLTFNQEYIDALTADVDACYARKKP